jgi:hypothetical protein
MVTIAKIGGAAGDFVLDRLRDWAAQRTTSDPLEWSSDQWPSHIREQADDFATRLRLHAAIPPVVHFIEWADLWSMGDIYPRSLTPPDGPEPLLIYGNNYEIYGYRLPDGGRLARHLKAARRLQSQEYTRYVNRLKDAIEDWGTLVDRSGLIILRNVVGGLVEDRDVTASLSHVPVWLSER